MGCLRESQRQDTNLQLGRPSKIAELTFVAKWKKGLKVVRLNRILSKNPEVVLGPLKLPNGEYSTTDKQKLTHLLEVHFPSCTKIGETEGNCRVPNSPGQENRRITAQWNDRRLLARQITSHSRIKQDIRFFSPYKSPGLDEIYPVLVQKTEDQILEPPSRITQASSSSA